MEPRELSKRPAEQGLKAAIIEFMRQRPFLWNPRHPSYKDGKRREREFQQFAVELQCSAREIKRVWHVLRTNFFRAHKLMAERAPQVGADPPATKANQAESGLWKYYLAMEYILAGKQGTALDSATDSGQGSPKEDSDTAVSERSAASPASSNTAHTCHHAQHLSSAASPAATAAAEDDEDHLYARALAATLRRFDFERRERIKLKFQEIIVAQLAAGAGD